LKAANHNITMADVDVIMKKVDKDRSNTIDRNEFITIMEEHFKEEQYLFDEEKNYILNLFREETQDNVGFLTIQQFKNLLSNKLNLDLTETELNELIQSTDCNFDGMIDIEEFVRLIDAADQVKSVGKTIRSIKMQKKFNPLVFLNIFHGLPVNFIPSFLRESEKSLKVTPSATLRPVTDATGILYEDIVMDSDLKKKSLTSLKQISTQVNCKIQFVKATGVPIPDETALDRKQHIMGRLMKIGLFNSSKNLFFGNTVSITCKWSEDYEDRWNFVDENRYNFNNNILIRYNNQEDM
jgi:Ca2+-binding EF-hand superfamily protein